MGIDRKARMRKKQIKTLDTGSCGNINTVYINKIIILPLRGLEPTTFSVGSDLDC